MRIMIKGGVWKNTEDEILKAAVMKYGMSQWARVASLLARKSAKQCKARWYEWLDPSIKKTEWSREEEEKLLHLAKLMPSQWRTIAPIVGRTAAQCMEHYERLLDAAQQKEGVEVSDDPRRLRPGEIDPNPENKPARPDPVDMDEDEKEMLSEARARLANTKGKKAKRKAREKQLEEARRLAALQKRRELKAAGITSSKVHLKKRKFIDYAHEIPFQKDAPAGFYDVTEEKQRSSKGIDPKRAILQLDKLEGKRRDDLEKKERKQDAKRQKSLMKSNLPQLIASVNEKNDPLNAIKRKPLELPTPVVSNDELSELAKMGMHASHAAALALESSAGATGTRSLMGDYTATPLRTPGTGLASQGRTVHDTIRQETANLVALRNQTTPLLGGENIELFEGTGYTGVTPSRTPLAGAVQPLDQTPMSSTRTPLRDELGINPEQMHSNQQVSARAERKREKRLAADLRDGFNNLPAPQNEYEINIPEKPEDDDDAAGLREEDAGDRDARQQRMIELQRELELQRRSSAVQRELPRPTKVKKALVNGEEASVVAEMYLMLEHDIVKHPDETTASKKSSKKRKKSSSSSAAAPELQKFSDEELERARQLVQIEASLHNDTNVWKSVAVNEVASKWDAAQTQYLAVAETDKSKASGVTQFQFATAEEDKVRAIKAEFDDLKEIEQNLSKRAHKLSERVKLVNGGLYRRADQALASLRSQVAAVETATIEQACFENLAALEKVALQQRMARLANDVNTQQYAEVQLQKQYSALGQNA